MNIQNIKTQDIKPYLENPRQNKNAINVVKKSLQEFGFQQPLVLDKDNIIVAGHTRLEAAKQLNIKEVPCIIADNLSEERIKAYRIMDNKSAEYASWDLELLTQELNDLIKMDFDLELTGFSDDELDDLGLKYNLDDFEEEGLTDEDASPELVKDPITKLGDIWILGNHRLICGDSTSVDTIDKLMIGNKADLIFTDPPYGMSYGGGRAAGSSKKGDLVKAHGMITNDDLRGEELNTLLVDALSNSKMFSKEDAPCYVCLNYKNYVHFQDAFESAGYSIDNCIVWNKKSIGLGMSNYRPQHEFIFYCKGGLWYGSKNQSDIWSMSRGNTAAYVHPTQKPVELIQIALSNSSKKGDIILDVFCGSGSTIIACESISRRAMVVDLDPRYADVIVKRWQNFTGKDAYLESSEETFDQLQKIQKNTNDG
tara:strand:+ start:1211 stop:2485 length:1275 start_codon:yes stop_codon:yes gene_type:complete